MATPNTNLPLPASKLEEIATEACNKAFGDEKAYEHEKVGNWNTAIIQSVLTALLDATPKNAFKFVVNSTVLQHEAGRPGRGMHSATGAFWDVAGDGTWSWKMAGSEHEREFDVVLNLVWVATGHGTENQ